LNVLMRPLDFITGGWRYFAGVPEPNSWRPGDYPALVAGWAAICRVYQTAPSVLDPQELEELAEWIAAIIIPDFAKAGIPVEMPVVHPESGLAIAQDLAGAGEKALTEVR
ncbi:MAG: hypothetical protein AAGF75_00725, partial [Cyanobacteria bacterium P01_H01_bin.130]